MPQASSNAQAEFLSHLEHGGILFLPNLGFEFAPSETRFLSPDWSDGQSKNIYLRGNNRTIKGAKGNVEELAAMSALIERYSSRATSLIAHLLPSYMPHAKLANSSLRCVEAAGRITSWRKDDRRLHADAFPSKPTAGTRILRVFTNVNPQNKPRVWNVGEPFADMAAKFLPKVPAYTPLQAKLINALGITKSLRGEYDHMMLHLHDLTKADAAYQANAPQMRVEFPANSSWVVYSDLVLHAVLSGQHMMEQTFHLPQESLTFSAASPKNILERLAKRAINC
ncbi:MAG: Kdo hydroxylase family protein [Bdellovibrio sp.]|nr:Kdo hydroxylase family protein [Methylotenera sp.]